MYHDLDGKEVSEAHFTMASHMNAIFHEHCQLWARKDLEKYPETGGAVFEAVLEAHVNYPQDEEDHYYWGFRLSVDDHESNMGYSVLYLYVAVSDELGGFDLVGFFEEGKLVYLISRVDTDWSDVWAASYPTGLITTPYAREGRFTNSPTPKEA